MKELTHASVDVTGPSRFAACLPAPPRKEDFYRDIAVVAFRLPAGERVNGPASGARLTGSIGASALSLLGDCQLQPRAAFPETGSGHRIEFDLGAPRQVRTMILRNVICYVADEDFPACVESSADGEAWRPAGKFCFSWDTADGTKPITVALGELNLRFLRLSFTREEWA